MSSFLFGMGSADGEAAMRSLVDAMSEVGLDELRLRLPEGVGLVASMHPDVRSEIVLLRLPDALDRQTP